MKKSAILVFAILAGYTSAQAQTTVNPVVRYSFGNGAHDDTGSGYDAIMVGSAKIVDWKGNNVLRLGTTPGYLDMGAKIGNLISTLSSFSISAKVRLGDATKLGTLGNFVWSFSNSQRQATAKKGYFFFGANVCEQNFSLTNYTTATLVKTGSALAKNSWKQITYTQNGYAGTLYIDGVLVATGTVGIQPKDLGKTIYNWLGRSCYSDDCYLSDAYIDEFKIYNVALTAAQVVAESADLSVYNNAFSDREAVAFDSAQCVPQGFLTEVRESLSLPSAGPKGSSITWVSSRPDLINNSGIVQHLADMGGNGEPVDLTATITKGNSSTTKTFKAVVAPYDDAQGYLMVYFTDETHSIHMALSQDGYSFTDINNGYSVMDGDTLAVQYGVRDPHIMQAPDGTYYLSMTDLHIYGKQNGYRTTDWERDGTLYGWGNNRDIIVMKSTDLINWSRKQLFMDQLFPQTWSDIGCAWAPETYWDAEKNLPYLYLSMRHGAGLNRVYGTYMNADYTNMQSAPTQLFKTPDDDSFIDADISHIDGKYYLFYVEAASIKMAVGDTLNKGYVYYPEWVDSEASASEAPNLFRRINSDKYVLMYDCYGSNPHTLGFRETTDFVTWKDLGHMLSTGTMTCTNFSYPKHAAVVQIKAKDANALAAKWGSTFRLPTSLNTGASPTKQFVVNASNGEITIWAQAASQGAIYGIDGRLVKSISINQGANHYAVNKGVYIVNPSLNSADAAKVFVN